MVVVMVARANYYRRPHRYCQETLGSQALGHGGGNSETHLKGYLLHTKRICRHFTFVIPGPYKQFYKALFSAAILERQDPKLREVVTSLGATDNKHKVWDPNSSFILAKPVLILLAVLCPSAKGPWTLRWAWKQGSLPPGGSGTSALGGHVCWTMWLLIFSRKLPLLPVCIQHDPQSSWVGSQLRLPGAVQHSAGTSMACWHSKRNENASLKLQLTCVQMGAWGTISVNDAVHE